MLPLTVARTRYIKGRGASPKPSTEVSKPAPDGPTTQEEPRTVKPGGGSFHHGLTWHGSAPNKEQTDKAIAELKKLNELTGGKN